MTRSDWVQLAAYRSPCIDVEGSDGGGGVSTLTVTAPDLFLVFERSVRTGVDRTAGVPHS